MRSDFATLVDTHNREFDPSFEAAAAQQRGAFLKAFPLTQLKRLTIDDYVMGKRLASFCAYLEPRTGLWANILGSTAFKFGIYFGKIQSDPLRRYRFVESKFGHSKNEAFAAVKAALLQLTKDGAARRFEQIDFNPLSPMFKAKILSLYFPDIYLNVCSREHINDLADELDLAGDWISERQHLLLEAKLRNPKTRRWSNPKFMTFLYNTYIRASNPMHLKGGRKRTPPKVDIDEMLERRKQIGKLSELYALKWEKERLRGLGYNALVKTIEDRRDQPGYGYDFFSHTAPGIKRYIEVKTAGRNWDGDGIRFFLSLNEHQISNKPENHDHYYFYLVYYQDKAPVKVEEWPAAELYETCEFGPNGYVIALSPD
ncbi:DUF3883 domain-containing protein [Bradyrhizobium sp. LA7.1]|uniref:DUF3883 domain-containing protein n=1 Tax=Bradyrhizobium sp. LA7.1 TaxID=3156324 RepID=UPI0033920068